MKAEREGLIELMFDNKRQYQIPVYQRNYDWKKDNCKQLFEDVILAYNNEKSHFLGTIVQVQQDEENGIKRFIIIDGQQRMTSIYLLLKAMYDLAENVDLKEQLEGLIYNLSQNKEFGKDEKNKLKLKPIKTDNEQFMLLMANKYDEMDKTSNIYINYNYFCSLIKQGQENEYEIKHILKGLKYLYIVMISLKEPEDEPQVIFERINSTGEDLQLVDLIRNYLLMTDSNMEELFEEYWLPMELQIGRDKINDYFLNYIAFKQLDATDKNAYPQFKNYADKYSHRDILIELKRYAKYYNVFIREDSTYSKEINGLLNSYRILRQSTIYPFLFSVFNDFEEKVISEKTIENVLLFYLNYTIRRIVTGVPSNSLRGLYKSLYKRIFVDRNDVNDDNYLNKIYEFMASMTSTKDKMPNDTVFKEKLIGENLYRNSNACKFLLSILENGITSVKEKVVIDESITIEHIMPQNESNIEWQREIGDSFILVYNKYLHTLGNLTLTGYNSELSDKPFAEKVSMIKSQSKFTYLNEDIVNQEHWSETTILSRAERLSSKLVNEFKLPEMFGKSIVGSVNSKHTVYDDCDMTNQKVQSFILLGEKRDVDSAADMLVKFGELLYSLDSGKIESMGRSNYIREGASTPLFSMDASRLRTAKEILNTGIYIETNFSLNMFVRIIKELLDKFGLSYDDFIYYTE